MPHKTIHLMLNICKHLKDHWKELENWKNWGEEGQINIPTSPHSVNSKYQFTLHPSVCLGIFVNNCYLTRKDKLHHLALIHCVWQIYFSIICGSETGQVELHVLLFERKMKVESLPLWFVASQSFEWVSTNTQHPFSLHLSALMSALTGKKQQLCIDRNHLQLSSVYHITAVVTGGRLRWGRNWWDCNKPI